MYDGINYSRTDSSTLFVHVLMAVHQYKVQWSDFNINMQTILVCKHAFRDEMRDTWQYSEECDRT